MRFMEGNARKSLRLDSDEIVRIRSGVHGTWSERIWTKLTNSVLMDFGAFGSQIGIEAGNSCKTLRTDLDEIGQMRSGGFS